VLSIYYFVIYFICRIPTLVDGAIAVGLTLVLAVIADGAPEESGTAAAGEGAEEATFTGAITNCAGSNHGHFLIVLLG
jgi:hypothetical protein